MDWENDPELKLMQKEFVESLRVRSNELSSLSIRVAHGSADTQDLSSIEFLVHKLAGAAASFGFPVLTKAAGALEDLLADKKAHLNHPVFLPALQLVQEALHAVIQTQKDALWVMQDPRMKALTSAVESL